MLRIALTGGIACGKSTVCRLFADFGVPIVDADLIARQLAEPHQQGWQAIVEYFGPEILISDGKLNRRLLRERIFADPAQRQKLDAIMHPLIYSAIDARLLQLQANYCLVAIPLLAETQKASHFDRVLLVDCPEALQLQRLQLRDNLDATDAATIIASQAGRLQRLAIADEVIDNSNGEPLLAEQVKSLHNFYLNLAISRKSPA